MGQKKKRFGQHFLTDSKVVDAIITAADLKPDDDVVEIGPGLGSLTLSIARRVRSLLAIEVDTNLLPELKRRVRSVSNIEIVNRDVLKFDFSTIPGPVKVVSNLPYNVSVPITFQLLKQESAVSEMILMYQKEVGDRLAASPGGKAYGSLSVISRFYREISLLFYVGRNSFSPPPKVESCVVKLLARKERPVYVSDEAFFISVVKASFAHRRKTLKNSLGAMSELKPFLCSAFEKSGISPGRRAETLSMSEFAALSNILSEESR